MNPDWKIKKRYKITDNVSVCKAELIGILKALETADENPHMRMSLLTDSLVFVLTLGNFRTIKIPDIKEGILAQATNLRYTGCQITIGWIPAHKGVTGNEQADRATKTVESV